MGGSAVDVRFKWGAHRGSPSISVLPTENGPRKCHGEDHRGVAVAVAGGKCSVTRNRSVLVIVRVVTPLLLPTIGVGTIFLFFWCLSLLDYCSTQTTAVAGAVIAVVLLV